MFKPQLSPQAWVHRGFYYVFGGEFTSPNQERFHHYKDLWRCELATNQWEQLNLKGAPSARSGHRCALYKSKLVLFGGFFDSGKQVKCVSSPSATLCGVSERYGHSKLKPVKHAVCRWHGSPMLKLPTGRFSWDSGIAELG